MNALTTLDFLPSEQQSSGLRPEFGLSDLAQVLRNPAEWPPGFEWDFNVCAKCAIGMAMKKMELDHAWEVQCTLKISNFTYGKLFCSPMDSQARANITPDDIAARIDAYLARTS